MLIRLIRLTAKKTATETSKNSPRPKGHEPTRRMFLRFECFGGYSMSPEQGL